MIQTFESVGELTGSSMDLYDSDTGLFLYAESVIDVSDLFSEQQVIVKYTLAKRGLIAQLCKLYVKGRDIGIHVHYFVSEMTREELVQDPVFSSMCQSDAADPWAVANRIFDHKEELTFS